MLTNNHHTTFTNNHHTTHSQTITTQHAHKQSPHIYTHSQHTHSQSVCSCVAVAGGGEGSFRDWENPRKSFSIAYAITLKYIYIKTYTRTTYSTI